uniref:Integrase catalytic domain-containing protein n=1 Tax=Neolamprologus brichardi TaxID=32507 RepID=A0A3Q4GPK8_NEOBR
MALLQHLRSEAVITSMKAVFARHGVFGQFAKEWDFVHTTSSPHYPQSNGLVEKSVQTVKRLMSKARDSGADFYQSLLVYRTTPLECGMSPAQLLMGRHLRSNLPIQDNLLKTKDGNTKKKFYYDKGTKNLPELHAGDQVRFKDKTSTWAQKATVLKKDQPRSYIIQTKDGAMLRRNRRDLLKGPVVVEQRLEAAEQPQHTHETLSPETPTHKQEQTLRRSVRQVKPPMRLIEQM